MNKLKELERSLRFSEAELAIEQGYRIDAEEKVLQLETEARHQRDVVENGLTEELFAKGEKIEQLEAEVKKLKDNEVKP